MQQANRAGQSTVDTHGATLPGAAPLNAFVINLCSSTSPVTLSPPDHAGLKRFSFFVSRRREESRERFRLHMGYFDTQEEAEKLLDIVREIYPGAWAGMAPGQRLRAAVAQALSARAPPAHASVAPARPDPQPDPMPAAVAADTAVPAAATEAHSHTADAAHSGNTDSGNTAALALLPDAGRRIPDSPILKPEFVGAARSLNDVRAAIASLEDTSERAPTLRPIPELKAASGASSGLSSARAADTAKDSSDPISDSGVLAVLERGAVASPAPSARTPVGAGAANSTATTGSTVAMPAPAQMRAGERAWQAAEEEAQPRVEKPYFAVQLMWSVQPMDIAQVPQLAIFSAYTLYGAEGNRDGRRWYGLRLGFFTDAVSAKQVAHYVRSEFSTVSVVPVTARERQRAHLASGHPSVVAPAKTTAATNVAAAANVAAPAHVAAPATPPRTKFEFIEDRDLTPAPGTKPGSASARPAPGKRAKLRTQTGVNGRSRSKPMTLEETLEILGAGELKMDDGRQPLINDSGVGRVKPAKNKSSRLGRLFERLSERLGS